LHVLFVVCLVVVARSSLTELVGSSINADIDYEPGRKKGKSFLWPLLQHQGCKQRGRKQHSAEVLRLLLPFCAADLCELDERGQSCLDVALATGNEPFLDALADLMNASATTTRTGGQECAPAGEGARQGKDEEEEAHHRQQQLREHIHNLLRKKNARGQTALLAAIRPYSFASQANLAVVRRLIKLGADVNEREAGTGNTALYYAATTNSVALCKCVRPAGVTCEELV
jgi:hypothetical protein